jgi:hypothetical protein
VWKDRRAKIRPIGLTGGGARTLVGALEECKKWFVFIFNNDVDEEKVVRIACVVALWRSAYRDHFKNAAAVRLNLTKVIARQWQCVA